MSSRGRTIEHRSVEVTYNIAYRRLTHCPLQAGLPVNVHMQAPFWQEEPVGH
jgi:hypothetical protein